MYSTAIEYSYAAKLYNSQYGSRDDVDHITKCFDKKTKLAFKSRLQVSYVRFGSARDNDASVGIKHGVLQLKESVRVFVIIL